MVNFGRHNTQIMIYTGTQRDTYSVLEYKKAGSFFGNVYTKTNTFEGGIPVITIEIRTRWFPLDPQSILVIGDTGYRITSILNPDFKRLELVIQVEVHNGFSI